ncbi:hypothetical protein [Accumulibacter sp.]|uniref:hypothetical protein n=1 Tax=Accumulibacter sp. TaxID=2053492 RepID=UPI00262C322E|nr:hypothetical protein [Accumulibacter sp.]
MMINVNPIPRLASLIPARLVTLASTGPCPAALGSQFASLLVAKPMPFRQYATKIVAGNGLSKLDDGKRLATVDRCLAE